MHLMSKWTFSHNLLLVHQISMASFYHGDRYIRFDLPLQNNADLIDWLRWYSNQFYAFHNQPVALDSQEIHLVLEALVFVLWVLLMRSWKIEWYDLSSCEAHEDQNVSQCLQGCMSNKDRNMWYFTILRTSQKFIWIIIKDTQTSNLIFMAYIHICERRFLGAIKDPHFGITCCGYNDMIRGVWHKVSRKNICGMTCEYWRF